MTKLPFSCMWEIIQRNSDCRHSFSRGETPSFKRLKGKLPFLDSASWPHQCPDVTAEPRTVSLDSKSRLNLV